MLWTLLLVLLGAAAALYVGAAGAGPTSTDLAVLSETLELRSGGLTTVAVAVTEIGSTVSMAVLASLVALWSLWRGRVVDAVLVFGAMVGAAAVFRGLKLVIDRPRPPVADRLVGTKVRVGEALVTVVEPVPRCVMVTRPQPGGIELDRDVLRRIHRERDGVLAVGGTVERAGVVRIGDEVGPA